MIRTIVFIRTSTDTQDISSQLDVALKYCKADDYSDEEIKIIGTQGASAIKQDKQYLQDIAEVYTTLENEAIEGIYLASLDRYARDEEILVKLKKYCINNKIHLKIADMNLSLLFPNKEVNDSVSLMMSILAAQAAIEMRVRKERFQRGRRTAANLGKYGGGYLTFGYKVDSEKKYIINEEEAEVVRTIFNLMASDRYSLTSLTDEMRSRGTMFHGRLMNYQMVLGILKNTAYIGYRDKYVFYHKYPPIISEELFNKVQEVMRNNNTSKPKAKKHFHFGALLIKCPECGRSYVANISKEHYRCSAHASPKIRKAMGEELCNNDLTIHLGHLDGVLWSIATSKHFNYLQGLNEDKKAEIQEQITLLELKKKESPKLFEEINEEYRRLNNSYNRKGSRMTDEEFEERFAEIEADEKRITNEVLKYDDEIARLNNLLNIDDSKERWFENFFVITEMKGEENEKLMYDLVHQYITDVKIERFIMPENLSYKIYKLDGRKATKITVKCIDNDEINLYFIPNLKHIENKVVLVEGSEVKEFPYEIIKRNGNGYATTESIQLTKDFISEFGNVIREDFENRNEIFNKTLFSLNNDDENNNELRVVYDKIVNKNNPLLLENSIDAVKKYYNINP